MATPVVRFGLLGCGTVGQGVVMELRAAQGRIADEYGMRLELAGVAVRNPRKPRSVSLPRRLLRAPVDIINDPNIPIIVELVGGVEEAKRFVRAALTAGKHVITANKALLAADARKLFQLAAEHACLIRFEASVGGGIPIIATLRRHYAGDTISGISGIINGTTNYILSQMAEERIEFFVALKRAQELGYAERDSKSDISGADAACKLAILCSLAFGVSVEVGSISTRGIELIRQQDIEEARRLGYVIKLLAIGRRHDGRFELRVEPVMTSKRADLASVSGALNAISVYGKFSGRQTFLGKGAGQMPTATSVFADLVEVAHHFLHGSGAPELVPLCWRNGQSSEYRVLKPEFIRSKFYLRVGLEDRPGAIAQVAKALGRAGVSIGDAQQRKPMGLARTAPVPFVITTDPTSRRTFLEAITAIRALRCIKAPIMWLPIEDEL